MTTFELLYLCMAIGAGVLFAATLAWAASRTG